MIEVCSRCHPHNSKVEIIIQFSDNKLVYPSYGLSIQRSLVPRFVICRITFEDKVMRRPSSSFTFFKLPQARRVLAKHAFVTCFIWTSFMSCMHDMLATVNIPAFVTAVYERLICNRTISTGQQLTSQATMQRACSMLLDYKHRIRSIEVGILTLGLFPVHWLFI